MINTHTIAPRKVLSARAPSRKGQRRKNISVTAEEGKFYDAKAAQKGWSFPYLIRQYGAADRKFNLITKKDFLNGQPR